MTAVGRPSPRPVALALVRRGDDLLVFRGQDPATGKVFFRPLGGGIEFGETAETAVRRELREELGAELRDVRLLGVLENIFELDGRPGHEIVFVFDASLTDLDLYLHDDVGIILDEGSPVTWHPLRHFTEGRAILYPPGLIALLGETA